MSQEPQGPKTDTPPTQKPHPELGAPKPQTQEEIPTKVNIELEFDTLTGSLTMKTTAPTIMVFAVLGLATSVVTQNQTMQRIQAIAAKRKILGPGDRGYNGGSH